MHRCLAEFQGEVEGANHVLCGRSELETTSSTHTPVSRNKSGTPQPNDLWRFFPPTGENQLQEEESHTMEETPAPPLNPFVEELMRSDASVQSRVQEVLGVLEAFETATSSWGESQSSVVPSSFIQPSRKWFSTSDMSFEAVDDTEKSPSVPKQIPSYLKQSPVETGRRDALLDQIPTWRVLSAAVYLSTASKEALLERCPPKLSRTSADHMSLMHAPDAASLLRLPLGEEVKLLAYGEKCGVVAQSVALKPPRELSTQKSHPHVTVSFAERVLKRDIVAMKGNGTFEKWIFPLSLDGAVGIKMDDGRVLFSNEEFYIETGVDLRAISNQLNDDNQPVDADELLEETEMLLDPIEMGEEPEETRPSDEIQRLVAHGSFSSRREDITTHSLPPSPQRIAFPVMGSRPLDTPKSCSERPGILTFPEAESAELKVLRVGKNNTFCFDEHTQSPSKHPNAEQKQQDVKKKQAELRSECEIHRQASRDEQRKGEEYLEMARVAYREGQRELGDKYNKVSVEATLKHRDHTSKAERLAFDASNLGRVNTHTVDLHHLHLQEAIARLKKVTLGLSSFVEDVRTTYRLRIITGKGMNSLDNVPVLRPAVVEFLKSNGLEAEIDEHNEGVVTAYINPPTS